jgi:formylglycine-generating enzyme
MSEHAWAETEPRFRAAGVTTADMIRIPGATFRMGSDKRYPEEAPVHRVTVGDFQIDRTPITNPQFKEFVRATGHVTFAEIPPDPKDYPGAHGHVVRWLEPCRISMGCAGACLK